MIYDRETNTLVYDVANPQAVLAAFPDAKPLVNGYVGIPAHLPNLQLLAKHNIPTIAPLDYDYDWPIAQGRQPFFAQRVMANFLALNPRCYNLSEMRTGKTLAALWAADYIMRQHEAGGRKARALIVAPLRTLKRTWANAVFQNFIGRRTAIVLHGDAAKRERLLRGDADFYIINHDGLGVGANVKKRSVVLGGMAKLLSERTDIQIAIIDEGSAYRDATTRRHRVARTLIQNRPYLWWLTGTPCSQGPLDAYGQAKLMNNANGETYTSYRERTMLPITQFKWVPRRGAHEMAMQLLSPAVRFKQDDVFDAPDCVYMAEDTEMSADQKRAYKEMQKDARLLMQGKRITAANEGVLRWKLIQIACGCVYDEHHQPHVIDAKPRIDVMMEIIESAPRKVIVFAPLTAVLHLLYREISKRHACVLVNGEVSSTEADHRIRRFQDDKEHKVLIAHPGPIARGLDLTAAATIIWYAPTDRTEDYIQANQRINGPAQTHKRAIVQIAGSPIEREIYKRLDSNESLQGLMLQLVEDLE